MYRHGGAPAKRKARAKATTKSYSFGAFPGAASKTDLLVRGKPKTANEAHKRTVNRPPEVQHAAKRIATKRETRGRKRIRRAARVLPKGAKLMGRPIEHRPPLKFRAKQKGSAVAFVRRPQSREYPVKRINILPYLVAMASRKRNEPRVKKILLHELAHLKQSDRDTPTKEGGAEAWARYALKELEGTKIDSKRHPYTPWVNEIRRSRGPSFVRKGQFR